MGKKKKKEDRGITEYKGFTIQSVGDRFVILDRYGDQAHHGSGFESRQVAMDWLDAAEQGDGVLEPWNLEELHGIED